MRSEKCIGDVNIKLGEYRGTPRYTWKDKVKKLAANRRVKRERNSTYNKRQKVAKKGVKKNAIMKSIQFERQKFF